MSTTTAPRASLWQRVRPWLELQELYKHPVAQLPYILGAVLAWRLGGSLDWGLFFVGMVALFLLTDGTYVSNEYFDYENDSANDDRIGGAHQVGVTTTGGTRVLVQGLVKRRHALIFSVACFALAVPLGLWMQFRMDSGPLTLPLGALGIFVGWFYSAPPIRAAYRGWGEAFMAVGFGLIVFGAYYIQHGFSTVPLVVLLPWAVAIPALKILREFPDYEADVATGKRNLTVQFGRQRMAAVYSVMIVAAILLIAPLSRLVSAPAFLVALLPAILLIRSVVPMVRGQWRDKARLEAACASGFVGMLTIPLAMTIALLIGG
ncbi:MAG: prenyltransferase [Chloroflexi bacterium]|nr:prenyltransferase [Chloroflexota bacterium]